MVRDTSLDLATLRIFIETAKDCNMTRAAQSLGISQPAVSAAIKKIELNLDAPLFDRERRPLQLTTAGRLLWNRAFLILEQLDDLTRSVKDSIEGKRPDLRLGASDCMSACICPSLLGELLSVTENLSARTGSTPVISSLLNHKNVDIALSSDPMEDVEGTRGIQFITERFLFVLPKTATRNITISGLKDLIRVVQDLPYLRFGKETFDFVQSERIYRSLHFMDKRRIEVDTNIAMFDLIARGKGWSILPPLSLWTAKTKIDQVEFLPLSIEATRRYFVLYNDASFEGLARIVYQRAIEIVENEIFPEMARYCPNLLQHISLNKNAL